MKVKEKKSTILPGAWIVNPKNKGRKSIKNGKVFLNDKDTFEIEIFNPLTVSVLADIKLNDQSISKTGLVIKPGQRIYLDCFIDDKKKFIFSTYNIDNIQESINATEKNGLLEVFFYKENVITLDNWKSKFDKIIVEKWYPVYYPSYPSYPSYPTIQPAIWCSNTGNISGVNTNFSLTNGTSTIFTSGTSYNINNSSIETGRVEKGERSKQQFTEIDIDFENNYIASTIIQILPESRRPLDIKEVKNSKIKLNDILKRESEDLIELIKKLGDLHSAGILTDEEFSTKKSELLSKI
jgi:hypothetical protein